MECRFLSHALVLPVPNMKWGGSCIRLSRCHVSSVPDSLDVSLFLELGCWGEGLAMSIAQYVSYGSLVVFLMWDTELYADIASPCHTVSRVAGVVFGEGGLERAWQRGYLQIHIVIISTVFLGLCMYDPFPCKRYISLSTSMCISMAYGVVANVGSSVSWV